MKKLFFTLAACAVLSVGFGQTPPCNGLVAEFTNVTLAPAGGIEFTDASVIPVNSTITYAWDFGNGTTSIKKDPFGEFNEGTYQVSLTVTDQNGCAQSIQKEIIFSYGQ